MAPHDARVGSLALAAARGVSPVIALVIALAAGGACSSFTAAAGDDAGSSPGGQPSSDASTEASPAPDAPDAAGSLYASAVLADNPSGYWRLGEAGGTTAHSLAGNGAHDGPIMGAPTFGQQGAIFGDTDTSLGLSSDGQFVQPKGDFAFEFSGSASFSLEAWVRLTNIDGEYRHLFAREGYDGARREDYGIYTHGPNMVGFERHVADVKVEATSSITPNMWHHVVATYDGNMMKLYVDGEMRMSVLDSRTQPATSVPLLLGATSSMAGSLRGQLDEVAVYPIALDASAVHTHYNIGSTGHP